MRNWEVNIHIYQIIEIANLPYGNVDKGSPESAEYTACPLFAPLSHHSPCSVEHESVG